MSNTPEPAQPRPAQPLVPHPEPARGSDQLANEIDIALTGSGIEVESIPESTRHSPWFRAGLCLRVFFALVFTGAFIWAVVRGLDWLDVFGLAVVTLCFWVVTYAAFRGIRISNLG